MTDARDYMISDERKAELDNEAAIADAKAALNAAGFRILGPDEVDPVTLEKCAEVAANWGSEIPAEIRALGRKA